MREHPMPEADMVAAFLSEHARSRLRHEIELLTPLMEADGYVAKALTLRQMDLAEINLASDGPSAHGHLLQDRREGFLEEWKNALRRNFNVVRMFNALAATFAERLRLLESLRFLEQDWEAALSRVVDAFVQDWDHRNAECSALACEFLKRILTMREEEELSDLFQRDEVEARLGERLEERIRDEEARLHADVCRLFRHDSRSFTLPEHSMLQEDLFPKPHGRCSGWAEGIGRGRGRGGRSRGAVVDVATLGHTLGLAAVVAELQRG